MLKRSIALALLLATGAQAQAQSPEPRVVSVSGNGEVETAPDRVILSFTVVGEGATPDDATRALADRQRAVAAGLAGLLGRGTEVTTGSVNTAAVTGPECQRYGPAQLSEGKCAITGYVATLSGEARSAAVTKAGTAVGLAQRLGARSAQINRFELADDAPARRRATLAAIADARARAEALAAGLGQRLGAVTRISDQAGDDGAVPPPIVASVPPPPPPPPPPPAPIEVDVKPRPITTGARVFVTFALDG